MFHHVQELQVRHVTSPGDGRVLIEYWTDPLELGT